MARKSNPGLQRKWLFMAKLGFYGWVMVEYLGVNQDKDTFPYRLRSDTFKLWQKIMGKGRDKLEESALLEEMDRLSAQKKVEGAELLSLAGQLRERGFEDLAYNMEYIAGLKDPRVGLNCDFRPEEYARARKRVFAPA